MVVIDTRSMAVSREAETVLGVLPGAETEVNVAETHLDPATVVRAAGNQSLKHFSLDREEIWRQFDQLPAYRKEDLKRQ